MASSKTKNHKTFSKSAAISYGFETMKKNFVFFAVLFIIVIVANLVPSMITGYFNEREMQGIGFISMLVGWFVQITVSLGLIGVALKVHDKKKVEYTNIFDHFKLVIPYFLASIIYGLIVLVGFILFIIPGIVWAIKFRYFSYFMVDQNMGPIDALKASSKITEGNKWNLFLLGLILAGINIIGALALLIGLLATVPTAMMAEAYVFRKLSGK